MKYYARTDGTRCRAIQFKGRDDENTLWIMGFLNDQGIYNHFVEQFETDEWYEDDEGEAWQVIEPEHIKLIREFGVNEDGSRIELGVDKLEPNNYLVERDGEYYVMNVDIFESIYTEVTA